MGKGKTKNTYHKLDLSSSMDTHVSNSFTSGNSSPECGSPAANAQSEPSFSFGNHADGQGSSARTAETRMEGPKPAHPGYADVLMNRTSRDTKLSFRPSPAPEVSLDEGELYNISNDWGFCLLGIFAGRFPGLKAVFNIVDRWKANCKVLTHPSGWLVFKFQHAEDGQRILEGKTQHVYGRPLLLKSMPPFFTFDDMGITNVPVWVRLRGLPIECWHRDALSKITSKIGNPICCDEATRDRTRVSHARVLVEVDAKCQPPESVPILLPNGVLHVQMIEYEHIPKLCTDCKRFGHYASACSSSNPLMSGPPKPTANRGRSRSASRSPRMNGKGPTEGEGLLKGMAHNPTLEASTSKNPPFHQKGRPSSKSPTPLPHDSSTVENVLPKKKKSRASKSPVPDRSVSPLSTKVATDAGFVQPNGGSTDDPGNGLVPVKTRKSRSMSPLKNKDLSHTAVGLEGNTEQQPDVVPVPTSLDLPNASSEPNKDGKNSTAIEAVSTSKKKSKQSFLGTKSPKTT